MERRSFVKNSLLTGALGSVLPAARYNVSTSDTKKNPREFYELRAYTLKDESKLRLVEDYFERAAIPALNRLGSHHIGVFREMKPSEPLKLYVLIPYASLDSFLKV